MKTKFITLSLIAAAALTCIGIAPAMAQHTPAIDNAQHRVHARIVQGTRSGHLTRHEANQLLATERQISRHEARFRSDGRISASERRILRNEIASLSNDVERKMANRQTRRTRG